MYPTMVSQMKLLLPVCSINSHFVPKTAKIAAPLNMPVKKREPLQFVVCKMAQEAVNQLRKILPSLSDLALLNITGKFTVGLDAPGSQLDKDLIQR